MPTPTTQNSVFTATGRTLHRASRGFCKGLMIKMFCRDLIPSPDAALGDVDGAAHRPYHEVESRKQKFEIRDLKPET